MRQFRETIHSVVVRLQGLAQELLFGWWPDVQLDAVQDNPATHRPGFSFLADPANKFQVSFRAVNKLAFSEQGGFSSESRRGRAKQKQYLNRSDSFVRLLYAAMHMTAGMASTRRRVQSVTLGRHHLRATQHFHLQRKSDTRLCVQQSEYQHQQLVLYCALSLPSGSEDSLLVPCLYPPIPQSHQPKSGSAIEELNQPSPVQHTRERNSMLLPRSGPRELEKANS